MWGVSFADGVLLIRFVELCGGRATKAHRRHHDGGGSNLCSWEDQEIDSAGRGDHAQQHLMNGAMECRSAEEVPAH